MSDALFYAFVVVVMWLSYRFLKRRRRAEGVRVTPEKQADAARAGWEFETGQTALFDVYRWRGTTEGVSWVAECLRGGGRGRRNETVSRILRWYTQGEMTVAGPMLMLKGDDGDRAPSLEPLGGGAIAKFAERVIAAALDKAVDVRFSETAAAGVDVASLTSVAGLERQSPGTVFMAEPSTHAAALLWQPRLDAALRSAEAAVGAPLSVLVTPRAFAISAQMLAHNVEELTPFVNAGVALVKAVR
jgi:hypothetical protein